MDAALLARIRWRRRGAWLWPTFLLATAADGLIGHVLPPAGETQSFIGAALVGCFLNLIAVALLSRLAAAALRRARPDLPRIVARDRAGTAMVLAITIALGAAGLIHRPTIASHRDAMREAIARAQAWIGDRAPREFRRDLARIDAYAIEPGSIYRACVRSASGPRSYCVVVNVRLPAARSVAFAGHETNAVFAPGAG